MFQGAKSYLLETDEGQTLDTYRSLQALTTLPWGQSMHGSRTSAA